VAYRTIVCGTDGSVTAMLALRTAARLAKRCRAELVVVCVQNPPALSLISARILLEHAQREVERERVKVRTELARGEPAQVIADVAARDRADLVVVGNKGMGHARRIRPGSIPDRVAHSGAADILIVDTRAATDPDHATPRPFRRFLIGTDGSPTANECARKGMELALMLGADVTLLYIGDPLVGAIRLEETASAAPDGIEVKPWIEVSGEPAEVIVGVARELEADLIVVGNRGMAGARRVFGSVPNSVAHTAGTNVLIAKTVDRSLDDVAPGTGAVISLGGKQVAVYRDEESGLHGISPRCTHMGCTVDWNDAEKTWDCPCHGSRYDRLGHVVRGPAAKDLVPQEVKGA
jgi:nucleotide-binding universal stress UspA family protein/nitrite reductase/ring-hydroxylating ferredoxin subunit